MKKSELKSGMIIELRNGDVGLVLLNTGRKEHNDTVVAAGDAKGCTWGGLCSWDENLIYDEGARDIFDIVKVYAMSNNKDCGSFKVSYRGDLLWSRSSEKEMTKEEVEEALGYKINIVS